MELERERRKLDSWADALVAVAERCLAADHATRGHHDAQTVVVHLRPDGRRPPAPGPGPARRRAAPPGLRRPGQDHGARPPRGGGQRGPGPAHRARAHPPGRSRNATGAVGYRGVTTPLGCRSTTSSTGSTAAPPTPGTWWRCAAIITASTTRADSTSRATPMTPTAWSSPTARAEGSWAVADPHRPATLGITGNWTPPSGERLDSWMVTFHEVRVSDEVPVGAWGKQRPGVPR